jgi:cytochrome c oxidase subunit 4
MSTDVATHPDQQVHAVAHEDRTKTYIGVFFFLVVITAIEVATYAAPEFPAWHWGEGKGLVTVLMVLMAVKFWTVAWFFMHLKWDKRLLNVTFYSGIVLALLVYLAVMTVFRVWWPAAHAVRAG